MGACPAFCADIVSEWQGSSVQLCHAFSLQHLLCCNAVPEINIIPAHLQSRDTIVFLSAGDGHHGRVVLKCHSQDFRDLP